MGSIKAIQLATVADLAKNLASANTKFEGIITKLRGIQKEVSSIETTFGDVSEEANILIAKAKEIGADQIVKDAMAKKAEADEQYKGAEAIFKALNTF